MLWVTGFCVLSSNRSHFQADTYSGGGYVLELIGSVETIRESVNRLASENWIDRRTRLVQVDLSVYNPFSNFFAAGRISVEFPPSGGLLLNARFDPIRLIRYHGGFGFALMACEVVFFIYILLFLVKEVRSLRRIGCREYLKSVWSWIEMVIIILAFVVMGFYIQLRITEREILDSFEQTNGNQYQLLETAVLWDKSFSLVLAFVMFLGTAKFTRLLRFNSRVTLLLSTIRSSIR